MRRPHKFLITSLVIGASALLIAWNTSAESARPALGVAEAKRGALELQGQPVAVRGTVLEGSIVMNGTFVESFVVADAQEQLLVLFGAPPPDSFGPKEVVVYGVMDADASDAALLRAESIQVGCSSKY